MTNDVLNSRRLAWVLVPLLCALSDCSVLGLGPGEWDKPYAQTMHAESLAVLRSKDTVYQRRMWDLRRRAAAVPTDSLLAATIDLAAVDIPQSPPFQARYMCTFARMMSEYGVEPTLRARYRMRDSLNRQGEIYRTAMKRITSNYGDPRDRGITIGQCGRTSLPDSLSDLPYPGKRYRQE